MDRVKEEEEEAFIENRLVIEGRLSTVTNESGCGTQPFAIALIGTILIQQL